MDWLSWPFLLAVRAKNLSEFAEIVGRWKNRGMGSVFFVSGSAGLPAENEWFSGGGLAARMQAARLACQKPALVCLRDLNHCLVILKGKPRYTLRRISRREVVVGPE
jgi:hypothetical protein